MCEDAVVIVLQVQQPHPWATPQFAMVPQVETATAADVSFVWEQRPWHWHSLVWECGSSSCTTHVLRWLAQPCYNAMAAPWQSLGVTCHRHDMQLALAYWRVQQLPATHRILRGWSVELVAPKAQ